MAQPAKADDYAEQVCSIELPIQWMHFAKPKRAPCLLLVPEEDFRSFHSKDFHRNHIPIVCPKHLKASPGGMTVRYSRIAEADRSTTPAYSCSTLHAIEGNERVSTAIRTVRELD